MRWILGCLALTTVSLSQAALYFDGRSSITVKDAKALHLLHGYTLEAWIRPDAATPQRQNFAYILSRNYDAGGYGLLTRKGPEMAVEATGWNPHVFKEAKAPVDKWTHVAVVNNNQITKLYLDGKLVGTQKVPGPLADTDLPLILGGSPFFSGNMTCNWIGALCEVRIWSLARGEKAIRRTMNRRLSGRERGLAAYFPMNEQKGMLIRDLTGHTSGGTCSGASDRDPTAPRWCEGPLLRRR